KSHEVGGRDGLHALHVLSDLPLSAGNLRLRGIRVAGDAPVGTEVENAGQADALRIGYGSDRRRPPALRREVLSDRHSLPRLRRGIAVSVSVGGHVSVDERTGRNRLGAAFRIPHPGFLGGRGVPGHGGSRLCLRLAEGGVPMAVSGLTESVMVTQLDKLAN